MLLCTVPPDTPSDVTTMFSRAVLEHACAFASTQHLDYLSQDRSTQTEAETFIPATKYSIITLSKPELKILSDVILHLNPSLKESVQLSENEYGESLPFAVVDWPMPHPLQQKIGKRYEVWCSSLFESCDKNMYVPIDHIIIISIIDSTPCNGRRKCTSNSAISDNNSLLNLVTTLIDPLS